MNEQVHALVTGAVCLTRGLVAWISGNLPEVSAQSQHMPTRCLGEPRCVQCPGRSGFPSRSGSPFTCGSGHSGTGVLASPTTAWRPLSKWKRFIRKWMVHYWNLRRGQPVLLLWVPQSSLALTAPQYQSQPCLHLDRCWMAKGFLHRPLWKRSLKIIPITRNF